MIPNAFVGQVKSPTAKELSVALGASKPVWEQLLAYLAEELDTGVHEWNSYSPKAGWSLKVKRGKRTIVYAVPCRGSFRVAFVLGDKAVKVALASKLPTRVRNLIKESKRYPEGTAVRMDVKKTSDLPAIQALAAIKIEN